MKKNSKGKNPREREKDRESIRSFYLSAEIIAEIERRAKAEERSSSWIVRQALKGKFGL